MKNKEEKTKWASIFKGEICCEICKSTSKFKFKSNSNLKRTNAQISCDNCGSIYKFKLIFDDQLPRIYYHDNRCVQDCKSTANFQFESDIKSIRIKGQTRCDNCGSVIKFRFGSDSELDSESDVEVDFPKRHRLPESYRRGDGLKFVVEEMRDRILCDGRRRKFDYDDSMKEEGSKTAKVPKLDG